MRRRSLPLIVFLAALLFSGQTHSQTTSATAIWQRVDSIPQNRPASNIWVQPEVYRAFNLNHAALKEVLGRAPRESAQPVARSQTELSLPMPDGSMARFRIVESPVMAPALAAKFPEIKTYLGQGTDDPAASVRFDITPAGFHAQILSPHGAVYIDPHFRGDTNLYTCYYKRDYRQSAEAIRCLTPAGDTLGLPRVALGAGRQSGANLRTYRLACAADGEYTQFFGGTVAAGMAAVVTAINRVTGVYETELAIRLELVANNDLIVYTNPNADPYSNNSGSTMLNQNQSNLDSVIGDANYDIGHVFSTGGGGIAEVGVVCVTGRKAHGVTGSPAPTGDAYYIDYVAHEMGHQFGANHTFNSTTSSCGGGNRNASTAYEPGSGSTIMSYAGICGADDLQPHSDPYFHSASFDEIISYTTTGSGSGCPVLAATGNSAPAASAGAAYTIPKGTPFILTAAGSDPNGDPLTYCWEERDLGPATTLTTPDNGSSPLFRSFNPTTNASRSFPRLPDILNNTNTPGEMLPATSRTMDFRVTARDNRAGGGGVNTADTQVTVNPGAGPFVVTFPNTATTLSNAQTITWNVAGTVAAPIGAASVNILLSTNGGLTFPIMLASNTPNDGAQTILLPSLTSASARIKVEAAGNIFFAISRANFSIVPGVLVPLIVLDSSSPISEGCAPTNNAVDPGETVSVSFALKNIGSASTTNLVATLLPTNGVVPLSGAQSYGRLDAGGAAAARPFTFVAAGACGGAITAVLQLQDGNLSLGTVNKIVTLGALVPAVVSFTNAGSIAIPASGTRGAAEPYPSTIAITGLPSNIIKVRVTLVGLSHTYPDDIDALLVGPTGQNVLLMSDTGGKNAMNGLTLTFDDDASTYLPDSTQIVSGTYKPTNFDTASDTLPSPAPGSPFGSTLGVFNGLNPNGTWSLYIGDDSIQDSGSLAQGWELSITTSNAICCSGVVTNQPPVLPAQTNRTMDELAQLVVTNTATDPDLPANVLNYALVQAPTGAVINASGVITWTPSEAQGPSTNLFTTVVTDNGVPSLSATNSFMVFVNEANSAPVLTPVADQTIVSGETLVITNRATDSDIPANPLAFNLEPGYPARATLNTTNGVFNWPTTGADANTTNIITVRVTDNGVPPLSDNSSFSVTVIPFRPRIESISLSSNQVTVIWTAVPGATYRLQFKTSLAGADWADLPPDVRATGSIATNSEALGAEEQRYYRVRVVLP